MSLELRGFYSECLDAMWDLQGCIPADVEKLAVMICCNPRTVRKLLPQLVGLGKLKLTESGYINPRMDVEISGANSPRVRTQFEGNSKGIRAEFDAKIPKNSMFSTRDLEEEKEEEEEEEKEGARARDEIHLREGKVEIGKGVAAEIASEFPTVDLKAVAIRAAVELSRGGPATHAHKLATVRRCALFETQATRGGPAPKRSSQPSVLSIIRGAA
jgi:hypothetical protein